jgi:N-acetylmuramoyl-L-alanine amidase
MGKVCRCCHQEIKSDSKYIWILDNGHGGIINGVYQTAGKRSPIWDDGTQLFEGEFNRAIVDRIAKYCDKNNIEYINLVDTNEDVPLSTRVKMANEVYRESDKPCIYVSIHANGFTDESANGWEVFTSPGETKSDHIATVLYEEVEKEFPLIRMRKDTTDGDVDKEAKYTVLMDTAMSAILSENFFMTNEKECKTILMSESGRNQIANAHIEMINKIENE